MDTQIEKAFAGTAKTPRRDISRDDLFRLQGALTIGYGKDVQIELLEQVARFCCYVEQRIQGRASGNLEDLIIRYMFRYLAAIENPGGPDAPVDVEIGVLFGATSIMTCHAIGLSEKKINSIVIDPFEGYYGEDLDPITGLSVNEERFWANLDIFGYGRKSVRIYKGYSSDTEIISECKNMKVFSLIIDGDHSYAGVKNDWINYSRLVVRGGYVLIDDYNSRNWPDVTEFINNEVLAYMGGAWSPVLVLANTIILKKLTETCDSGNMDDQVIYDLNSAKRTNQELQKKLKSILNSPSWRITAPLRYLFKLLKGIRHGKRN